MTAAEIHADSRRRLEMYKAAPVRWRVSRRTRAHRAAVRKLTACCRWMDARAWTVDREAVVARATDDRALRLQAHKRARR